MFFEELKPKVFNDDQEKTLMHIEKERKDANSKNALWTVGELNENLRKVMDSTVNGMESILKTINQIDD